MKGVNIEKTIETLQLLLLSLPECCFFNVISIGHKKFHSFFEKSQKCSPINIEEAIKKAQKITAKGGTHIYEALEWVFKYSLSDMPTSIILFSDFETSYIMRIIKLIKNQEKINDLRIFSIGINIAVSHHFIDSIVQAGKGYAEYVSNSEQMNRKAVIMLRNSLNPPIADYKITWTDESNEESQSSNTKFQQAPLKIPELYVGVRFIVYCILAKGVKSCEKIILKSESKGPLHILDPIPLKGSKIHTLAAKKLIQEIEHGNHYPKHANNKEYIREQIVHLAKSYNLSSKYTRNFFGGLYESAAKLGDQIENAITFDNDKHYDHEKAEALIIVEESAIPKKCKEIVSHKNEDGSIELDDTICNDLDAPKEETITTFQNNIKNRKLKKQIGEEIITTIQFPSGDFFIKSAASTPDASTLSTPSQNWVIDIKRSLFMSWGAVKDGTKAIVAKQESDIDQDDRQLWSHEDGWLINKQTNLCLEVESVKEEIYLSVHHKRNPNQANNQRWILTPEGRIALKNNPKFVIEVLSKGTPVNDGSHLILVNTRSRNFKNGLNSKFVIIHKKKHFDGVIRIELVCAKDLKNIDSSTKGKCYVRVFDEDKEIIARTNFIDNNLNPIWNEVHYLPVKKIGDKFLLDVMNYNMKDESLGNCHFEVTRDLIKESTQNDIIICEKLSVEGQIHYKAKFFSLEPIPQPTPDFLKNLKEKPFNLSTFYLIVTLQKPNGSFPSSDKLANLFGYESPVKLLDLYKSHCYEDHILVINQTVWTTSMIMWFLQYILKEYRSEWFCVYKRATQYIRKEIHCNLETEKTLLSIGEKVVNEIFDININVR
ncbi:vWA-like protein [Gigaspora margarita]|uniref:VWA-like protein n=1 Tax=Gigaspora margarita TaxID=4874 RepID=A0A8H4B5G1_GIGMA|nr:vWA-like protein [Gigaspora margarita]